MGRGGEGRGGEGRGGKGRGGEGRGGEGRGGEGRGGEGRGEEVEDKVMIASSNMLRCRLISVEQHSEGFSLQCLQ